MKWKRSRKAQQDSKNNKDNGSKKIKNDSQSSDDQQNPPTAPSYYSHNHMMDPQIMKSNHNSHEVLEANKIKLMGGHSVVLGMA